jgi:predicted Zn-ribbon and HTH transcriptional regulator
MSGQKVNNENIDGYLLDNNRLIKRIDDAHFAKEKINWQCLVPDCNYVWSARIDHIKRGSGCPKCAFNFPLTNERIDQWLIENNVLIKRVGEIKRSKNKIEWECLAPQCGYSWLTTANTIKGGSGCPKCANFIAISNQDMDQWLIDNKRAIKRIGDMNGVHVKIHWQCLKCDNIWEAPPGPIRYRDQGCPVCNTLGYNQKLILDYLLQANISFEKEKNIKELDSNETRSLRIDFYFPIAKIAIEYNGLQHYKPWRFSNMSLEEAKANLVSQQWRDEYKRNFCKNNDIVLIEIDGREYKNDKLLIFLSKIIKNMKEKQYV